ncbi:hypothetical protein Van01_16140 [Micromonospora andamanensis]|uniref:Zinc-ribbon domain-containing protein n=1 Tax=Micromonospora andamanensis TaxID=1287068 RepID=A0ABQ4HRX2_9ACTN|nr:hypothetical protein Van01_16140 [Micromonospora andamanensis]
MRLTMCGDRGDEAASWTAEQRRYVAFEINGEAPVVCRRCWVRAVPHRAYLPSVSVWWAPLELLNPSGCGQKALTAVTAG